MSDPWDNDDDVNLDDMVMLFQTDDDEKKKVKKRKATSELVDAFNRAVEPVANVYINTKQYELIAVMDPSELTEEQLEFKQRCEKFISTYYNAVDKIRTFGVTLLDKVKEECKDNEPMMALLEMIQNPEYQEMHYFKKPPKVSSKKAKRIQDAWTGEVTDSPKGQKLQNYLVFNSKSTQGSKLEDYVGVYLHPDGADIVRLLHSILNFRFYLYNRVGESIPLEGLPQEKWKQTWEHLVGDDLKGVPISKWTKKKSIANDSFVDTILKMRKLVEVISKVK